MLHVVHQEQENDQLLDGGELGPERKLYYRELIARFAHHPALVWNLGEENTNTTAQLKSFARYIHRDSTRTTTRSSCTRSRASTRRSTPRCWATPSSRAHSLQVGKMETLRRRSHRPGWTVRRRRAGRGRRSSTRSARRRSGVKPDSDDPDHDDVRRHALWSPLMVGGSGAEWLFGVGLPHNDTNCEDFRSRDQIWDQTRWALEFFRAYIPVRETEALPTSSRHHAPSAWPSPARSTRSTSPRGVHARSGWRTATTRSTGTTPAAAVHCLRARWRPLMARASGRWDRPRRSRAATGSSSSAGSTGRGADQPGRGPLSGDLCRVYSRVTGLQPTPKGWQRTAQGIALGSILAFVPPSLARETARRQNGG